jgi:hypothetical protein
MPGPVDSGGFLEGNAVALPSGHVALLLRCRVYDGQGRTYTLQHACLFLLEAAPAAGEVAGGAAGMPVEVVEQAANEAATGQHTEAEEQWAAATEGSAAERRQAQRRQLAVAARQGAVAGPAAGGLQLLGPMRLTWQGFVDMPGGGNKFTARFDPSTGLYLALTNPSIDRYGANPDARNILVLVYSSDLLSWRVAATLLVPNDGLPWDDSLWRTAYQYPDWIIDGQDLLVAIRTAWGGAASFHDNNWLTFKRVPNYRRLLPSAMAAAAAAAA